MVAAFDLAAPTFRHKEFAAYKAQREKQPDELYEQVVIIEQVLDAFKIPRLSKAGYEADDIIGTVVTKNAKEYPELDNLIVTGDLDALQLVDGQTQVYTLKKGISETITYNSALVKERYGLIPDQLIDMKALKGDASDNIPGVRGIGEKGAVELIKEFKSLDNLYQHLDSPKIKERLRTLLKEQKKEAYQSQRLVTIVRDLPLKFKLSEAASHKFDRSQIYDLFKELEFNSLLNKIPTSDVAEAKTERAEQIGQTTDVYKIISGERALAKLAKELKEQPVFALDTETTGLDPLSDQILGASVSWQAQHGYYLSLRQPADRQAFIKHFKPLLEAKRPAKVGHNLKYDYQILKGLGITLNGITFDTLIAAFALKPGRGLKLSELAYAYFKRKMVELEDIAGGKGKNLDIAGIPEAKLGWYAAEDADYAWQLYKKLEPEIKQAKLEKLLQDIELPLIPVLAEMELAGIDLDIKLLKKMAVTFAGRIKKLEQQIHKLAGQEFNIASPLQLKDILFNKLGIAIKGLKKTKTGISTAASELDKLQSSHPIIPLLSEYRELTKLQSTYITALPKLVSKVDRRLHTSFNQAVAATGRLSSNNPNLQNIPIRTELGRDIRQAFIAKRGYRLLSADYSQIELRLVAHIAKDSVMIKHFLRGDDIHRATAAAIHKIKMSEVTFDQRRQAKEVNFGVIYGLGSTGLAQRTGISREEAKDFIEKYFNLYQGVKRYIEATKQEVHQNGVVRTLFGRPRYLPEIHSPMGHLVAQAERMAINMPLQGTAADIIKLAMIKISEQLDQVSAKTKLLLQVHDELVLEVPEADLNKVAKFVKTRMENVIELSVPLTADVKAGRNWADMTSLKI